MWGLGKTIIWREYQVAYIISEALLHRCNLIFFINMSSPLTTGAIRDILTNPDDLPKDPVLQVLGLKKIQPSQGSGTERYRLVLSDGDHVHTCAMLATQLNDMVNNGELEAKAIVRLDKFICNVIQETRKVLIILELSVLQRGCDVSTRFGDPKAFTEESSGQSNNTTPNQSTKNNPQQQNKGGMQQNRQSSAFQQQKSSFPGQGNNNPRLSNGPSYGSNQPVSRNQNQPTVYPISSLNPYQNRWTICARVTSKSNIRTWSNSRGEGRLFNVDLIDESGEIRATCFTDFVDKFYNLLEANKVYYISKGSLRPANKKYSSIKNDYELHFNHDTTIEPCTDNQNLPTLQFNFTEISKIENVEKDHLVDLVGVCSSASDLTEITIRATNKQVSKRDITLLDSTASVSCTLWGTDAENFEKHVGSNPIIAIKGAKVSDFGGRSLSILSSSTMQVNPEDLQEGFKLRGWYDSVGSSATINSISGQRMEGFGSNVFKSIHEIKTESLGMSEKPDFFSVVASIGFFRKDHCLYKACPKADCNKKVMEDGNHYRCEKCNQTYPDFKHRLILGVNITDFSGEQWVTCFQDSAEQLLSKTADEVGAMKDEDDRAFEQLFADNTFKTWIFRIRAKMETYNDESRLKCTVTSATHLDHVKEGNRLLEEIQKLE